MIADILGAICAIALLLAIAKVSEGYIEMCHKKNAESPRPSWIGTMNFTGIPAEWRHQHLERVLIAKKRYDIHQSIASMLSYCDRVPHTDASKLKLIDKLCEIVRELEDSDGD